VASGTGIVLCPQQIEGIWARRMGHDWTQLSPVRCLRESECTPLINKALANASDLRLLRLAPCVAGSMLYVA
jgi:hypothetical protein